jgi:predicted nucleic acid-binding protein
MINIWQVLTMFSVPEPVFIDTSGFIGVMVEADQYFKRAAPFFDELLEQSVPLITTNLVIAESYPLIQRFSYPKNALLFLEIVRDACQKNYLKLIYGAASHQEQAELLLRKYEDHDLSLVDAISFSVMKERNIAKVFGFDSHFRLAGFELVPAI